jgi:hypothetical protein
MSIWGIKSRLGAIQKAFNRKVREVSPRSRRKARLATSYTKLTIFAQDAAGGLPASGMTQSITQSSRGPTAASNAHGVAFCVICAPPMSGSKKAASRNNYKLICFERDVISSPILSFENWPIGESLLFVGDFPKPSNSNLRNILSPHRRLHCG